MGLWKIDEAAEYLGIRPKTLYEWVRLDRVPYRKIGFNVRFDPDELKRWTAEQARGEGSESATKRSRARRRPGGRPEDSGAPTTGSAPQRPAAADAEHLRRLASEASTLLRGLERDVGANLSFPQRRKLLELADRLGRASAEADGS